MPTPSKFTEPIRTRILEALGFGASLRTAAREAGIGHQTLLRWLEQGKDAPEGSRFRVFYEQAEAAQGALPMRALRSVWNEVPNNPMLAWKVLERRESGYEPPMPTAPRQSQAPIVIQLALAGGQPLALQAAEIVEGEIVGEDSTPPSTPA